MRFELEISSARSIQSAVAILNAIKIDAVICDRELSDGDGLQILEFLESRKSTIPFFLYSGKVTIDLSGVAYQYFNFLKKPYIDGLIDKIIEKGLFKEKK